MLDQIVSIGVSYFQHNVMDTPWHMGIGVAIAALLVARYQYRVLVGGK